MNKKLFIITFFMGLSSFSIADENYNFVISSLYNEKVSIPENKPADCLYDDYNYFLVIEDKTFKKFKDIVFWNNNSIHKSNRESETLNSYTINNYKYNIDNLIETVDKEISFYHYYSICRTQLSK